MHARTDRSRVIPRVLTLASLSLLLAGCPRPRPSEPPAPNGPPDPSRLLEGPLSALSPEIKASDFRVTPPVVDEIRARRAPNGTTIVDVQFAPDPRLRGLKLVSLFPDGRRWNLRDDGTEGDQKAGDGVFSTGSPLRFDALLDEQRRLRTLLTERKVETIPRFNGMVLVGHRKVGGISPGVTEIPLLHSIPNLVSQDRSLMITSVKVVEDPSRTVHPCTGVGTPLGKWTFGHLMTEMAGSGDPTAFTENFFQTLKNGGVTPDGLMMPGNAQVQTQILDPWPKKPNSTHIDLARAPLKLLAIVNRIDLAGGVAYGAVSGAEGRFIFEVMDQITKIPSCPVLGSTGQDPIGAFLVIVEYGVPISTCTGLRSWAAQWMALDKYSLGSSAYNAALEKLTEQFVAKNVAPGKPNGSALNHIRINQIPFSGTWNLRQLHLTASGFLQADNPNQTPVTDNTPELATWVNGHATAVLEGTYIVPPVLNGAPFLTAQIDNSKPDFWTITGVISNAVRHDFSLNTCNGCHGRETGTQFTQVGDQLGTPVGHEAVLSGFLTGITIADPVDSSPLSYAELQRRAGVLDNIATSSCEQRAILAPILSATQQFHLPIPPLDVQPTLTAD